MKRVRLSSTVRKKLAAPVRGRGGFQSLIRQLQTRLEGEELLVDDDLQERIEHYAVDFGSGGWQTFLRQLLSDVESATAA